MGIDRLAAFGESASNDGLAGARSNAGKHKLRNQMSDITAIEFTFEHLANWAAFEEVRDSGLYNMLDPRALASTGLSREDYAFVMKNYSELKAADAADRAG